MDGELGGIIRAAVQQVGLTVLDKAWDNGFREITSSGHPIRTPADLEGFKIRSPVWTSSFTALGASPLSLAAPEMYSALQTKVAVLVGTVLMILIGLVKLLLLGWRAAALGVAAVLLAEAGLQWAGSAMEPLGNYNLAIFFLGVVGIAVLGGVPIRSRPFRSRRRP